MIRFILITFFLTNICFAAKRSKFLPKTFQAKFEQSFKSVLSGKLEKSRGEIFYKYPGHIYFDVQFPDPFVVVANPKKTWQYTPPYVVGEKGQVIERPSRKLTLFRFFDVLKDGLKSNALYGVEKTKKFHIIEFNKKTAKDIGIVKTELYFFNDKNPELVDLEKAILYYHDKRQVTLVLKQMKINIPFKKGKFIFDKKKFNAE
jgi:outer membrane lipoprotein-sorting protein